VTPTRPSASAPTLAAALEAAFFLEHAYYGELDGAGEDDRVWMLDSSEPVLNGGAHAADRARWPDLDMR
jgi:hypothetical protein